MAGPVRCPICRREIPSADQPAEWRPFCSPRCRSVDLGGWLSEGYRVPAATDDEIEDPGPPLARDQEEN